MVSSMYSRPTWATRSPRIEKVATTLVLVSATQGNPAAASSAAISSVRPIIDPPPTCYNITSERKVEPERGMSGGREEALEICRRHGGGHGVDQRMDIDDSLPRPAPGDAFDAAIEGETHTAR